MASMSSPVTPAFFIAMRAAAMPMSEVFSPGAAMRRCRMPVREAIHSSLVSTSWAMSSLVMTWAGV